MDNASKALIMAGAILIAVAIVGIGIYIFSASNSLTNNAVGQIDTIAVQMFNQTLTQYATKGETINGTRAKQLWDVATSTKGLKTYFDNTETDKATFTPTAAYNVNYTEDGNTHYITEVKITTVK